MLKKEEVAVGDTIVFKYPGSSWYGKKMLVLDIMPDPATQYCLRVRRIDNGQIGYVMPRYCDLDPFREACIKALNGK